ncbi:hypothetical protein MRX96_006413 [Rhipicephalus microplus]
MGTGARGALRPLLMMPSPSSVRASLVLGWREKGARPGIRTRSYHAVIIFSWFSLPRRRRPPLPSRCARRLLPACAAAVLSRCQPSCASPEEKVRCPDAEEVTAEGESA